MNPDFTLDAFRICASDYLLKPINSDDIKRAMNHLRNPVRPKSNNKLYVQCFGNFEVFFNEKPLHFKRSKTKELLAYLVDRKGSACTMKEIISVLWEDSSDSNSMRSNLRNIISDLKKTLAEVDVKSILIKERNTLAVDTEQINCDYYDFIHQIPYAVNSYQGEYMLQYSWAEFTIAQISLKN